MIAEGIGFTTTIRLIPAFNDILTSKERCCGTRWTKATPQPRSQSGKSDLDEDSTLGPEIRGRTRHLVTSTESSFLKRFIATFFLRFALSRTVLS